MARRNFVLMPSNTRGRYDKGRIIDKMLLRGYQHILSPFFNDASQFVIISPTDINNNEENKTLHVIARTNDTWNILTLIKENSFPLFIGITIEKIVKRVWTISRIVPWVFVSKGLHNRLRVRLCDLCMLVDSKSGTDDLQSHKTRYYSSITDSLL